MVRAGKQALKRIVVKAYLVPVIKVVKLAD